mmetsp:Transcript_15580/g.29580  ORF Transcript_15580/g.29580 Transcript_15580/m.29580 type:complete len:205 (+) Transcript_15580:125-739(+)
MIWMKLGNSSVCFEPFQRVLHQTLFTQCVLQLPSGRLTPPYSPGVRCWRISVQVTSRLATSLAVKKTDSTANSNIFFCLSSTKSPESSKALKAPPTATDGAKTFVPQLARRVPSGLSDLIPPIAPGEEERTIAVLPENVAYICPWGSPRDNHVKVFTSNGVGNPLYSGLATIHASCSPSLVLSSAAAFGIPLFASKSWLYTGRS